MSEYIHTYIYIYVCVCVRAYKIINLDTESSNKTGKFKMIDTKHRHCTHLQQYTYNPVYIYQRQLQYPTVVGLKTTGRHRHLQFMKLLLLLLLLYFFWVVRFLIYFISYAVTLRPTPTGGETNNICACAAVTYSLQNNFLMTD